MLEKETISYKGAILLAELENDLKDLSFGSFCGKLRNLDNFGFLNKFHIFKICQKISLAYTFALFVFQCYPFVCFVLCDDVLDCVCCGVIL